MYFLKTLKYLVFIIFPFSLLGCVISQPNTEEVTKNLNFKFSTFRNTNISQSTFVPTKWWTVYKDKKLDMLVETAISNNPSLDIYMARIKSAESLIQQSSSLKLPSLDLFTDANYERTSPTTKEGIARGNKALKAPGYHVGIKTAWEIDLWGRISNLTNVEKENLSMAIIDKDAMVLSISTEVAIIYWKLCAAEIDYKKIKSIYDLNLEATKIISSQHVRGFVNELDVADTNLERLTIEADLEEANRRYIILEQALAELLGLSSSDLPVQRDTLIDNSLPIPPQIEPGLPATVLSRRPDLTISAHNIKKYAFNISIAEADLYPSIRLVGDLGFASESLTNLLRSNSGQFSVGPLQITLPFFDGGLRQAKLRQANAEYDETIALHKVLLLRAMHEVDDNLADISSWNRQVILHEEALDIAKKAEKIALSRYEKGFINYLSVINAKKISINTERRLMQNKENLLNSSILLIKSLGGGYENHQDQESSLQLVKLKNQ